MGKVAINLSTGSLQKEEIIVGIDLGTSNSLVAFINPDGNPLVINDANKGVLVPSVVHFANDGSVIVGNEAKAQIISNPEHTIFSVKRLLGRSYSDVVDNNHFFSYKIVDDDTERLVKVTIDGKYYTPIELSALILKELKERAEHALKTPVNKAVITVPAYFNDSQRQATRDAGKLAGLDVLRIVNEPTAASLAYGLGLKADEEKTVAVYDLGGGTFDVSILRIENGVFDVLSTNGDTFLGGDDFDKAIVDYWLKNNNLQAQELDKETYQAIRLQAEDAKKHLSQNSSFEGMVGKYQCNITNVVFEELIQPFINKTLDCCKNVLSDAGLEAKAIDTVLMVGGSTRTPLVKKTVTQFFGKEVNDSLNPDEVVALGAAVQADVLAGNRKDILLLDLTPLSLGIGTMGGLMDVIIPRNSKVPTKAGRQYTTSVDGQIAMKIAVYQGERDLVEQNRKLAEFDLRGIPAMPAGMPKVDINFLLDADGILTIQAVELRSGVKQQVVVRPSYGLTDEQVELMLFESITNAETDVANRMLLEAKVEAQNMLYVTEKFLRNNSFLLIETEIQRTNTLIEDLKNIQIAGTKDEINASIDKLNEYTRPFAERAMDVAVGKALKGKSV